jgi:tellurite resistance protein
MANPTTQASYTTEQVLAWLRGLLTIAWADGHFEPEEQELILSVMAEKFHAQDDLKILQKIMPEELAAALGSESKTAENFLRTAVMVAIADGVYSFCEDELLYNFAVALGQKTDILAVLRSTLCVPADIDAEGLAAGEPLRDRLVETQPDLEAKLDLLHPVRDWLEDLHVQDPRVAHFLCRMIPSQCPFERDINLFGHKVVHIPPLCKLNPLYEQLVSLRFRALSYLADECHEDISPYI